MYCCYVLRSRDGRRTYAGSTCDLARRLRQHNGDLRGGARATRAHRPWAVCWGVRGVPDQRSALRFEWRLKQHRGGHANLRGPALQRRATFLDAAPVAYTHLPLPAKAKV